MFVELDVPVKENNTVFSFDLANMRFELSWVTPSILQYICM